MSNELGTRVKEWSSRPGNEREFLELAWRASHQGSTALLRTLVAAETARTNAANAVRLMLSLVELTGERDERRRLWEAIAGKLADLPNVRETLVETAVAEGDRDAVALLEAARVRSSEASDAERLASARAVVEWAEEDDGVALGSAWSLLVEHGVVGWRDAYDRLLPLAHGGDTSVLGIVEELARSGKDDRALLPVLELRLAASEGEPAARRVPMILELARRGWGATGDADIAIGYLRDALKVSPTAVQDVRAVLRDLAESAGDGAEGFVGFLQELARRGGKVEDQVREGRAAAGLLTNLVQRRTALLDLLASVAQEVSAEDATSLVREALQGSEDAALAVARALEPIAAVLPAPVFNALEAVLAEALPATEAPALMHGLFEARLAGVSDEKAARELEVRLARLEAEALGRPDLAAARVRPWLDDPTSLLKRSAEKELVIRLAPELYRSAPDEVTGVLEAAKLWEELAALLEGWLRDTGDNEAAPRVAARLAAVLGDQLSRPEDASHWIRFAVQRAPENREILSRYRALTAQLDQADEEHSAVERLLHSAVDPEEISRLQRDRVKLLLRLGQADVALIEAWRITMAEDVDKELEGLLTLALKGEGIADQLGLLFERLDDVAGKDAGAGLARWIREREDEGAPVARVAGLYLARTSGLDADGLRSLAASLGEDAVSMAERVRLYQAIAPGERTENDWMALASAMAATGDDEARSRVLVEAWGSHPTSETLREEVRKVAEEAEDPGIRVSFLERAAREESRPARDRAQDLDALAALFEELGRPDLAAGTRAERLAVQHDEGVVHELRTRAVESGQLAWLFETLDASANTIPDGAERAERERELGCLLEDRLGRPDVAVPHWRRALAHAVNGTWPRREAADRLLCRPEDVDSAVRLRAFEALRGEVGDENAVERVVEIARGAVEDRQPEHLGSLLDVVAERLGEASPALRSLRIDQMLLGDRSEEAIAALEAWRGDAGDDRLPRIYELRLLELLLAAEARETAAIALCVEQLKQDPDDEQVLALLGAVPRQRGLRSRVAEALAAAAEGTSEDEEGARLFGRAATLHFEDGEEEKADSCLQAALKRDPLAESPFQLLLERMRRRGDREGLTTLLTERLESEKHTGRRIELHRELARLAEDDEGRVAALEALREEVSEDLDALRQLVRLYRGGGQEEKLAEVLQALGRNEETPETRKRHLFSLARLYAGPIRDAEKAAETLQEILVLDPTDSRALKDLERSCRARKDSAGMARVLALRAEVEEDLDERIGLLRELARLQEEELEDPDAAVESLEKIRELEPGHLTMLEELARLHAEAERWEEHIAVLEQLAEYSGLVNLRAEVFLRAARVLHQKLDRREQALDLLSAAATMVPFSAEQIELTRQVAEAGELWREWANVLKRFADQERDDRRRAELYAELGSVLHEKLDDSATAFSLLSEVFRKLGEIGPVLDVLEEVAESAKRREQLLPVYAELKQRARGNEELLWRALGNSAKIAEEVLNVPDKAFNVLVEAARLKGARSRAEVELERIAREHDMWDRHREYLESRWQEEGDAEGETAVLLQKARVEEEELGNWEAAFESLIAAFQGAPFNERVRAGLYRLAEEHNHWDIVLRLMEALQGQLDGEERIALLTEMANVFETRRKSLGDAFEQCMRAWELDPSDETVRTRLQDLATRAERLGDLLNAWLWEASRDDAPEGVAPALERAWPLAEQLDNGLAAIDSLGRLCVMKPADDALREELAALGLRFGMHEACINAARAVLEDLKDRQVRARWLAELERSAEAAGQPDVRLAALDELVDIESDEPRWQEARKRVLLEIGRVDTLVGDLRTAIGGTEDPNEALNLAMELRDVLLRERGTPQQAAEALGSVAQRFPDHGAAWAAWEEHLEQYEMWEQLVRVLVENVERMEDAEEQRLQLVRACSIADEYLGDPALVLLAADAVLKVNRKDVEALDFRARALAAREQWADHVECLRSLAKAIGDGRGAAMALAQAAGAAERQLEDIKAAISLWDDAAKADPTYAEARLEQARLIAESGDVDGALGQLEALAAAIDGREGMTRDHAVALTRKAQLLLERNGEGDHAEALALLARANDADPENQQARELRLKALGGAGDAQGMLKVLEEQVSSAANDEQRARALFERASWRVRNTTTWRSALKDLNEALQLTPDDSEVLTLLADVLALDGHFEQAAALYGELQETLPPDAATCEAAGAIIPGEQDGLGHVERIHLRRAWALENSGSLKEAFDLYMERTLDHPEDLAANAGLARVAAGQGNHSAASRYARDVFQALEGREAEAGDARLRANMHLVLARAAEEEQKPDEALRQILSALDLDAPAATDRLEFAFEAALNTKDAELRGRALDVIASQDADPDAKGRALVEAAEARFRDDAPREEVLAAVTRALLASKRKEVIDPILALLERMDAPDALDRFLSPLIEHAEGEYLGRLLHVRANARQQLDRLEEAFADASGALRELPFSATILKQMVAYGRGSRQPEKLAEQLTTFLENTPPDETGIVAQGQRALAEVLMDDLKRPEAARGWLEALRTTFPNDIRVLESLLQVYEDESNADDVAALGVASDLVRLGALSDAALRTLERVYYAHDNVDGVLQVLQVQRLAGVADEEAVQLLESLPASLPILLPDRFGKTLYDRIIAPVRIPPPVRQVVGEATAAVLPSVVADDNPSWTSPEDHSLVLQLFRDMAESFSLPDARLMLDPSTEAVVTAVATTEGRTVVVPAHLVGDEVEEAPMRFILGRGLVLARNECILLGTLKPFDFMAFLEAALAPLVTDAEAPAEAALAEKIEGWKERIGEPGLPAAGKPLPRHQLPAAGTWRDMMNAAAVQAGVLASYESRQTFHRLRETAGEPEPTSVDELRALISRQADLQAIVVFLLSPRYLEARRELGLAYGDAQAAADVKASGSFPSAPSEEPMASEQTVIDAPESEQTAEDSSKSDPEEG